jgi:hypothetical protein
VRGEAGRPITLRHESQKARDIEVGCRLGESTVPATGGPAR